MLQIEGAWYCPSIPQELIDATIDFRADRIDESTYRARLAERWNYRILTKVRPDHEGHPRLRCPASNPSPVARCDIKPASKTLRTRGRLTIPIALAVASHTPKICTQQSITVPPKSRPNFTGRCVRKRNVARCLRHSPELDRRHERVRQGRCEGSTRRPHAASDSRCCRPERVRSLPVVCRQPAKDRGVPGPEGRRGGWHGPSSASAKEDPVTRAVVASTAPRGRGRGRPRARSDPPSTA